MLQVLLGFCTDLSITVYNINPSSLIKDPGCDFSLAQFFDTTPNLIPFSKMCYDIFYK